MAKVFIVGYGNPLRGDDGIGWRAAEFLAERLHVPNVEIRASHQLTPEMAEPISRADLVIFVDAACDHREGEVISRRVAPDCSPSELFSHQLTPEALLGLAKRLYGRCSEAVLLSVGAASFEYGETLSPAVEAALPALLEQVQTASGIRLEPSPASS